jgi:tetratricopeptide (TPR) repeat protein
MNNLLKQAVTYHQSGNLTEAEKMYRDILRGQPNQPDAMALLGLVCGAKNEHDEAIALIERAATSDPKSALFKFQLGTVLMNAKKLPEAVAAFRQAIALQPGMAQAYYNMANALRAADDWTGAIDAYRKAIQFIPGYAEAYNNLALSLVHERQYEEALAEAKKAVEVAPDYGEGWRTLCNIAEQVKDYPLALRAGERCIELMPDSHFAWFGYGVALCRLDRNEEAIEAYKRALALKPERADIWDNLGQTYQGLNRLGEAEATYRKTIEVAGQVIADEDKRDVDEKEYGNRHWHLALMELLQGKYKPGFARYRARFEDVGGLKRPNYSRPLWKGEDLHGKTILICDEQGFGDTLMLARYLPLVKARGAKIIFSVHPVLEPLFKNWSAADSVITHGSTVSNYDCYASVFDLPHRFGTTLETVPSQVPYLPTIEVDERTNLEFVLNEAASASPPALAGGEGGGLKMFAIDPLPAKTKDLPPRGKSKFSLPPPQGGRDSQLRPRIGVVWGGSPLHKNDEKRSIPLAIFADLFQETGSQFFSLNRDMKDGDAVLLPKLPVIDLAPRIDNFADAARFIQQLDLVITCDTATAHLAGGLGKPVWILLPFAPDWRWLTEREDNPWYPTARLFRQDRNRDWKSVIVNVLEALRRYYT